MVSISNIKGSNGSGQAVRGAVTNARAISSTTLKVDSVTNYPSQFIATTGKLGPSGILDNTTVQVFFGHLSGADIIIDSFAPGYTDKGNSVADIVILKPTTAWADEVAGVLGVAHNDNGTIKNNAVKTAMLDAANIDASVALKDASVTSSKIDFGTFGALDANGWRDYGTHWKKTITPPSLGETIAPRETLTKDFSSLFLLPVGVSVANNSKITLVDTLIASGFNSLATIGHPADGFRILYTNTHNDNSNNGYRRVTAIYDK